MTPPEAPEADAAPDAPDADAEAGALRLVEAFHGAIGAIPEAAQGPAVLSAVGGLLSGVLASVTDDDARRWAWQALWHQLMRAGVKHGIVEFGCDDPTCEACAGKGAGETRPIAH